MLNQFRAARAAWVAAVFALAMVGCGGGGGSSLPPAGGSTVSGTAATGAAISNATITIAGAAGGSVTASTGPDGKYTADVSGLTAPYLVKVQTAVGATLYSVGTGVGTVNIHPLTDLIVRTWYEVQGTTADVAFGNPVAAPPPTATEVAVIASVIEDLVEQWLVAQGIDPLQFDLISTAFNADSSGFDAVLDALTVDTAGHTVTVDADADGTPEQTTSLTVAVGGDVTASTTVTVGGVTSTSFSTAFVPGSAAAQAALDGVLAALSNMASVVNTNGVNLVAAHLAAFYDSNFMNRGLNATQDATQMASDFAGLTFTSFTVDRIVEFDEVNNIVSIFGRAVFSEGGTSVEEIVDEEGEGLTFKRQADGSWKFYGNQEKARVNVKTLTEQRMLGTTCSSGCDGIYYALEIQVGAPVGVIQSATVTGNIGGMSLSNVALTKSALTYTGNGVMEEYFNLEDSNGWWYKLTGPSQFPAAGSSYTIDVTFADATTASYTKVLGASTSEAMTLQSGVEASVGHTFSSVQDTPVTLSWNLPVSFPIKSVEIRGFVSNGTNGCDIEGPNLAATATTGSITLPSTCNSLPVQINPGFPSINVVVTGTSGETTSIQHMFQ